MQINKEKFADVENAFTRLKASEHDTSALSKISDALHSITGKNISVITISPTNKAQACRIMSVYPEESTIDAVIQAIITEQHDAIIQRVWNESTKWTVEIDTRILSSDANLTERELTALLLHEVGHIVYSNSIPMKISKVVRLQYAKSNMVTKQLLKNNFFSKVLAFPILHACNMDTNKNGVKAELQADKYPLNAGYGEDLKSAMDKIFIYAGSSKETVEDGMEELMGFSIDSLTQLQKRQNTLVKKNFAHMVASTPSRFAQGIINPLLTSLHGSETSSMTESVKDEFIYNKIKKITDDFYMSEAFFNKVKKLKRIDPLELDYIGLEVNNIKSNDDRMMVVSYIYSKLDIIDYYISIIDSGNPKFIVPHSREALVSMRELLDKYRLQAINKKLPEVKYGISIQYPSGYEG